MNSVWFMNDYTFVWMFRLGVWGAGWYNYCDFFKYILAFPAALSRYLFVVTSSVKGEIYMKTIETRTISCSQIESWFSFLCLSLFYSTCGPLHTHARTHAITHARTHARTLQLLYVHHFNNFSSPPFSLTRSLWKLSVESIMPSGTESVHKTQIKCWLCSLRYYQAQLHKACTAPFHA